MTPYWVVINYMLTILIHNNVISNLLVFDSDDGLLFKSCGTSLPEPIMSKSNSLRIVFKTDHSRNAIGFKASWTVGDVGVIKTPNYPLAYPDNSDQVHYKVY